MDNGIEAIKRADDIIILRFQKMIEPSTLQRSIGQVIRIKTKEGEFMYFDEILSGTDSLGNFHNASRRVGMEQLPIVRARKEINPKTAEPEVVDVSVIGVEDRYFIPFSKQNFDLLRPYLTDFVSLVVKETGNATCYSGFTIDEFMECDFDELLRIGKYGRVSDREYKRRVELAKKNAEGGVIVADHVSSE